MVSKAYSEAFVEVLAILDNILIEEKKAIPKKFLDFLEKNASNTYRVNFDKNKSLKELKLKKETKGMLSLIYYNYICSADKKSEYFELLKENQTKYEKKIRELYNPNNIFKNNTSKVEENNQDEKESVEILNSNKTQEIIEYKESIIKRILNRIRAIIHV